MKIKPWQIVLSSLLILAPIGYGLAVYQQLPAQLVSHWGLNNQPDGWLSRPLVVFGLPLMMLLFHWVVLGATWWAGARGQQALRLTRLLVWLFPVVTLVAYTTTMRANLGQPVNVRLWAIILVAVIFIGMGNYLPTAPVESGRWWGIGYHVPWRIKNYAGAKRSMRALGYLMVGGGVLLLLTLPFPPLASTVALGALICAVLALSLWSLRWTR